ncbi:MAG: CsiV family protein [Woeseiaceae bacterium]|nr:CsiV family protein [Woeseiaceae bacterium]
MHRPALLATAFMLPLLAFGQELLTDAELIDAEAEEIRRYTVELIVFAYAEDVSVGTELFIPEVVEIEPEPLPEDDLAVDEDGLPLEGPIPDDSVPTRIESEPALPDATGDDETTDEELLEEEEDPFQYVLLTEEELTMLDTLDRLDRLDAYQPLLHVGWTQTTLPLEETPALTLAELGVPTEGLDGSFTLYLSRFLHLVVDLALDAEEQTDEESELLEERFTDEGFTTPGIDQQVPALSYEETALAFGTEYVPAEGVRLQVLPLRFQIEEDRIMKSGDVRYFDHPKFGVVAKVERYEEPEMPDGLPPGDDTSVLLPAVDGQ